MSEKPPKPLFRFGNRLIGPGKPVFVVAEAGVNHNGDLRLAERLIRAAKRAGADAVKFQTFIPDRLVSREHPTHRMLTDLMLPFDAFRRLKRVARGEGIPFFSTPFDHESLAFLVDLGVSAIKLSSGEVTNISLLRAAAHSRLPVILSTGASRLAEVDRAVETLRKAGSRQRALLHCVSRYPADPAELNLRTIPFYARRYPDCVIGFSDHTLERRDAAPASVFAVAAGAVLVEKHLTLDCGMKGPDHRASADPAAFFRMVREIRRVETILGEAGKTDPEGEGVSRAIRRGVYARAEIRIGKRISLSDIDLKRPVGPIPADRIDQVLGRVARRQIPAGTPLSPRHIR